MLGAETLQLATDDLFAGGGEMGALMRARDWSSSPLGHPHSWPQSLRTSISILLESRFAMVVAWGPEFRFFYNDAYRPVLGETKHPFALGTPCAEIFPEIWDVIGPAFEGVRRGEAFQIDDWLLPLNRNGYLENCYFTLSYSPIRDESGGVGGLLAVVAETTGRVEGERRLATLRELARRVTDAKTPEQACATAAEIFDDHHVDVPFSLAYLLNEDGSAARLVACSGVSTGTAAAPPEITLQDVERNAPTWPLKAALDTRALRTVTDLPQRFGALPGGPHPEPAHTAVIMPLARPGAAPYGAVVLGVSPRRALDERYRAFYELAADHIVAGVANALAYEEERRRAEALAELDRAKTAFFSNVSHEFRTPLTLLLGPLEELLVSRRGELGATAIAELEVAHRNALRLNKLVNSLLDFTRIEAGRIRAVYEPTDLARITADLASSFRSAIERAGLRFVVDCPPLPQPVYVDRELWEKVVLNLLSNALKFTFEGEIAVRLRWQDDAVALEVQDTGAGIPAHELPHIFKRFHRVSGTPARTHEGTGIGLALVQDLLRLHGGDITVDSEPGRGSLFTATLRTGTAHLPADQIGGERAMASTAIRPDVFLAETLHWIASDGGVAGDDDTGAAANTNGAAAAGSAERPRVLVVDDNADMRAYIVRLLAPLYDIETAANGEEALACIGRRAPELLLADVMMPRLDGFGLLAQLRADERTRTLPVILLSARAGEESTVEGLRAGADDYLVKPFTARELLARVRTHIELGRVRTSTHERIVATIDAERRRLAEIFESAPALISVMRGPHHVYEAVNAEYRRLVHRDVIGKPFRDVFPELESQGFIQLLDRAYQTGERVVGNEARLLLHDPETGAVAEHYVNFVHQPLHDAHGAVNGIFSHAVDVTQQVQARLEIDELYRRVREANDAKAVFLANMSHELRTPLNAVLGFADVLNYGVHGPLLEAQREDVARIKTASHYLLGLINDILNFARVEAGEVDFSIEDVSAATLLDDVCELVVLPMEQKGIAFYFERPDAAIRVRADAERAQQALLNLLTNAVKFTAAGGTITLSTTSDEHALHIHVRDTGCGISNDQLQRIFDPFVQVDRSRSGSGQLGVGLGLTISRDLARRMDGDITVESRQGAGSVFTLTLPRA